MQERNIDTTNNKFGKHERLCSEKDIEKLFQQGKSVKQFPFRLLYSIEDDCSIASSKLAISVPKRLFKRAVKRNYLKRRIREAFRLNKNILYKTIISNNLSINMMVIYTHSLKLEYNEIDKAIRKLLDKLSNCVQKDFDISIHPSDKILP